MDFSFYPMTRLNWADRKKESFATISRKILLGPNTNALKIQPSNSVSKSLKITYQKSQVLKPLEMNPFWKRKNKQKLVLL